MSDKTTLAFVAGALAWGLIKSYRPDAPKICCPVCADDVLGLKTAFKTCVTAPLMEEGKQEIVRKVLGYTPAAVLFGSLHADPKRGLEWNARRVADATAGGFLYNAAHRAGGLPLAFLAHAAHNFGCQIGEICSRT